MSIFSWKKDADSQSGDTAVSLRPDVGVPQKPRHPMEALLKTSGNAFVKVGELVDGTVLEKKGTRVYVDLGPRGMGIIYGREYYAAQDIIKKAGEGDPIAGKVVEIDNDEGYIELSLKEAGEEKRWIDVKESMEKKELLELPVVEANKGGLLLEYKGIRGFLPASQLSMKHYPRVEGRDKDKIFLELKKFIGPPLKVKILDASPKEQKLIFSEKDSESEETRALLANYKIGDVVEGEVTGVVDFGAFMKFGEDLEGLIHISEIDWGLVENPRDYLKPGDKLTAKIIDIQGEKVSLSLKQLKEDPWKKIAEEHKKGDVLSGRVTKFNPFGAFVEIGLNIQGLVHISEFGNEENMRSMLEVGKEYSFKILLIDPVEHKMSLGIIREEAKEEPKEEIKEEPKEEVKEEQKSEPGVIEESPLPSETA